ncbi:VOC family protein [Actinocorallia longicatena]|uniref:VOC family protein n=1 Tax=Actinocorallia longicatena TaxID=111803 RepID=A0ABP6QH40_9ACTN
MTDKTPAPAGSQRLVTFFVVQEAAKAITFYEEVFGARTLDRFDLPDGTVSHAELELGGSRFQLSDPIDVPGLHHPLKDGNVFTMTFWTPDPDGVFAKAVAGGATVMSEVADVFSGDRMGVIRCPYGIRWCIARHDRDVPPEEIAAAAQAWMEENA